MREEEEASRNSGKPHLLNLNEDPLLDRKVIYDIPLENPLTCGRRKKDSEHKLQLGGMGIEPDHCKFIQAEDGTVTIIPLCTKAMNYIKVNGSNVQNRDGVVLKPNDRICIGPSAIFIFKHRDRDSEASMPDTDEDPISFDFASEEVINVENAEQLEQEEIYKKQ